MRGWFGSPDHRHGAVRQAPSRGLRARSLIGASLWPLAQEVAMRRTESAIRRLARQFGYRVHKSRAWKHVPNLDNAGEYMLLDNAGNYPVLGHRYDATLEDIDMYLKEVEAA
jgi:hypothetical protein